MSRDSNGVYSLPVGNPVVTGTLIESDWANDTMSDIGDELTSSLDRAGRGSMLAPLKLFDGIDSLPGLTWGNDINTGFYRIGADEVGFSAGAALKQRWSPTLIQFYTDVQFDADITVTGDFVLTGNTTITGPVTGIPSFTAKAAAADPSAAMFEIAGSDDTLRAKFEWTGTVVNIQPAAATDPFQIGGLVRFTSTDSLRLPTGTTAQRPASPADGDTRYNSTLDQHEVYSSTLGWMGGVPPGAMMIWGGASAPIGWHIADGTAVSRTDNPFLFAAYSTTYGAGDGSTTFNLPDMRMRAPFGVGTKSAFTESFATSAVNLAADTITLASNTNKLNAGTKVQFTTTGTLPAPLALATNYWVTRVTGSLTDYQVSTTVSNAGIGTVINLTSQGTGTHTITEQLESADTITLGQTGGNAHHNQVDTEIAQHTHDLNGGAQVNLGGGASPAMTFSTPPAAADTLTVVGAANSQEMQWMPPFVGMNYIIKLG